MAELTRSPTSHSYHSQRLRLHFLDWGNEHAPHLLLVHGIRDHCHSFDPMARALCGDFHVVAPDLRGHGDSEWARAANYAYTDYVYDLAQLLHQQRLDPVVVVGHSMGGTLAALLTGIYPEQVARLVLLEPIGLFRHWRGAAAGTTVERGRAWVRATRALAGRLPKRYASLDEACARMREASPHLSAEMALHLTVHGANRNEDGTYSWKFDNYTHTRPLHDIADDHTVALWERITCPTLIVNARNGYPHRIGQDGTARHFRNVDVVDVDDAGHWLHHDQPGRVLAHVQSFLGRSQAAARQA
jgi:pimeloyl-ACP methyl ester carboxylesterase